MEMHDLGYTEDYGMEVAQSKPAKSKKRYPSFCLYNNVPKALMDLDIGDEVRLELVAKVTNKGINENENKKSRNMDFSVKKVGLIKKGKGKSQTEYENMSKSEREEYDRESVGLDSGKR